MSASHIYKRRLFASYFSVVSSTTLVLFVLSVLGFVLLNSQSIANYFKEQVVMTVFLEDETKEMEREQLVTTMRLAPFIKEVRFILSREERSAISWFRSSNAAPPRPRRAPRAAAYRRRVHRAVKYPQRRRPCTAPPLARRRLGPSVVLKAIDV